MDDFTSVPRFRTHLAQTHAPNGMLTLNKTYKTRIIVRICSYSTVFQDTNVLTIYCNNNTHFML